MCAGHSKTPLATKLGIRDGSEIVLAGAPPDFLVAVAPLPGGFVDIKVCAVTEVWSGLKLVVRRELR
jgi:hypothetical protein